MAARLTELAEANARDTTDLFAFTSRIDAHVATAAIAPIAAARTLPRHRAPCAP